MSRKRESVVGNIEMVLFGDYSLWNYDTEILAGSDALLVDSSLNDLNTLCIPGM
jgi:hypothetical protein